MPQIVVVGSFVQDLAFSTASFPEPGETRIGTFASYAGGKGFNQAVACTRLEMDTLFVGALGEDAFAETAKEFAVREGIAARFQICPNISTGAASVTINEAGENTIVVALGANGELATETVEAVASEIASASVVLCQLEVNLAATRQALELGRKFEVTTILDTAPINEGISRKLLDLADIITPNETEFAFLYEKFNDGPLLGEYWREGDEALHDLCRTLGVPTVILTLGSEGCFVSTVDSYRRFRAAEVTPVDTTGAGDAFSGGLAAGLCRFNHNLYRSVEYATRVAALSVEKKGAAPSMPTETELQERFLNT